MSDLQTSPAEIERRVRAVGSNLREFCRLVPMRESTFQRWKNETFVPGLRLFRRAIAQLEDMERDHAESVPTEDAAS